jgi:hypothetical protein
VSRIYPIGYISGCRVSRRLKDQQNKIKDEQDRNRRSRIWCKTGRIGYLRSRIGFMRSRIGIGCRMNRIGSRRRAELSMIFSMLEKKGSDILCQKITQPICPHSTIPQFLISLNGP